MEQKGFFCYNSWLKALEPYGDAEKGRIWTTLLEYSNGLAIDGHSSGNERFILPMLLDQIDRDAEKREQFAEKQRENGKKGGRPPKPKETQQNPENPTQAKKAKDKNKNKDNIPPTPLAGGEGVSSRFVPPTPQEVDAYCQQRQNGIDGSEFCDFYASKGWMIGKSKMKDWRAAVRTWEKSRQKQPAAPQEDEWKGWH
uniref:DUF6291 domain-containing protein n=1 Tax=Ackermannviridae sp. TaxID=2831612 RepID=A0A8S5RRJ2_9CAUD|nr:MAG TPA: hypothetical protein [Ackermannviridae sp.]